MPISTGYRTIRYKIDKNIEKIEALAKTSNKKPVICQTKIVFLTFRIPIPGIMSIEKDFDAFRKRIENSITKKNYMILDYTITIEEAKPNYLIWKDKYTIEINSYPIEVKERENIKKTKAKKIEFSEKQIELLSYMLLAKLMEED
ncbi:MAG: hypothetical protein QME49_01675 [bacterium]|nr:hypothetical protein [bacterium]